MPPPILGIHHITALATDPQRNLDFYTQVLGLRLVKQTVNFDDPGTYHLYYGDEAGSPGTILTFFPWPGARRGTPGAGQMTAASFRVPEGSLRYWEDRLLAAGIHAERTGRRFGNEVLTLADPDGLRLELVACPGEAPFPARTRSPVGDAQAIRGFVAGTLRERDLASTLDLLSAMGFRPVAEESGRHRLEIGPGGGTFLDLEPRPEEPRGIIAGGSFHHVAWRVADDASQAAWRDRLAEEGMDVTPVIDRTYFRSVYFREPGGVLFELATDPPGFTVDEPLERLGGALQLPPWLEPERQRIERPFPPSVPPERTRETALPDPHRNQLVRVLGPNWRPLPGRWSCSTAGGDPPRTFSAWRSGWICRPWRTWLRKPPDAPGIRIRSSIRSSPTSPGSARPSRSWAGWSTGRRPPGCRRAASRWPGFPRGPAWPPSLWRGIPSAGAA